MRKFVKTQSKKKWESNQNKQECMSGMRLSEIGFYSYISPISDSSNAVVKLLKTLIGKEEKIDLLRAPCETTVFVSSICDTVSFLERKDIRVFNGKPVVTEFDIFNHFDSHKIQMIHSMITGEGKDIISFLQEITLDAVSRIPKDAIFLESLCLFTPDYAISKRKNDSGYRTVSYVPHLENSIDWIRDRQVIVCEQKYLKEIESWGALNLDTFFNYESMPDDCPIPVATDLVAIDELRAFNKNYYLAKLVDYQPPVAVTSNIAIAMLTGYLASQTILISDSRFPNIPLSWGRPRRKRYSVSSNWLHSLVRKYVLEFDGRYKERLADSTWFRRLPVLPEKHSLYVLKYFNCPFFDTVDELFSSDAFTKRGQSLFASPAIASYQREGCADYKMIDSSSDDR